LVSEVTFDYDRTKTIDSVWVDWVAGGKTDIFGDYQSMEDHSNHTTLTQTSANSFRGNLFLPKLSEGTHSLTVWVTARQNYLSYFVPTWAAFSQTINFIVDTIAPNITALSPANANYDSPNVPLTFIVNDSPAKVAYSLDKQANVTIDGNTTVTNLPNGSHNVTVYAWDNTGNVGSSQTIDFSVQVPEPLLSAPLIAAIAAALCVVGVVVAVYLRKSRFKRVAPPRT
jgi:hypothetical protein